MNSTVVIWLGLLCGGVFVSLGFMLIFRPKNHKKVDIMGELIDVDEVVEKTREIRNLSKGRDIFNYNPNLFNSLFKVTGINIEKMEKRILRAGLDGKYNKEDFAILQLASIIGGLGILFFLMITHSPPVLMALFSFISLVGFGYPSIMLDRVGQDRLNHFVADFPQFLSAIAVPLENGMAPIMVLEKVSEKFNGVVGEEFRRVVYESRARGNQMTIPLEDLTKRVDFPALQDFVSAFTTALRKTSSNMAETVSQLSRQIRVETKAKYEERFQKLNNKIILVIMVFFVLPYLGIIMLPALINVGHAFH